MFNRSSDDDKITNLFSKSITEIVKYNACSRMDKEESMRLNKIN